MALSGTQRTRIAVGGPGLRYSGFTAKSQGPSTFPRGTVGPFTRLAVAGPGLRYPGFTAKGEAPPTPTPTGQVGGGASGKRYPLGNLDLDTWQRKGKRLEARIAKLEKRIEAKRDRLEGGLSLEAVRALKRQIAELQKKLLELLAELDFARKGFDEAEAVDALTAYFAYRRLH